MNPSAISSYNGDYYNTLTSPFISKKVSINAYTPIEPAKPATGSFSQADFQTKKITYSKFNINVAKTGYISSNKIIENSLKAGYSASEAIKMYKAHNAYGIVAINSSNSIARITTSYDI